MKGKGNPFSNVDNFESEPVLSEADTSIAELTTADHSNLRTISSHSRYAEPTGNPNLGLNYPSPIPDIRYQPHAPVPAHPAYDQRYQPQPVQPAQQWQETVRAQALEHQRRLQIHQAHMASQQGHYPFQAPYGYHPHQTHVVQLGAQPVHQVIQTPRVDIQPISGHEAHGVLMNCPICQSRIITLVQKKVMLLWLVLFFLFGGVLGLLAFYVLYRNDYLAEFRHQCIQCKSRLSKPARLCGSN